MIAAAAPRLDGVAVNKMETAISSWSPYVPDEDTKTETRQKIIKWNREYKYILFNLLPVDLLREKTKRRLVEERRCFGDGRRRRCGEITVGWIGSPVSADQMALAKDDAILGLFNHLPDATGWDHPTQLMAGGSIQASREFGELAKRDPDRALRLIDEFQPGLQERPAAEALQKMAELETVSPQIVVDKIHQLDRRGFHSQDFRMSTAFSFNALGKKLDGLDDATCDMLEGWLVDAGEKETPEVNGGKSRDEARSFLWHNGDTSTGGNYTILDALTWGLLRRKPAEWDRWLDLLDRHLNRRESVKVWQAMAPTLRYLQNAERDHAVAFIEKLLSRFPDLGRSEAGVTLLACIHRWLPAATVRSVVEDWQNSEWCGGAQAVGEFIVLRHLLYPEDEHAADLCRDIVSGAITTEDERLAEFRLGASYTTAHTWGDPKLRPHAGPLAAKLAELVLSRRSRNQKDSYYGSQESSRLAKIPEIRNTEDAGNALMDVFRQNNSLPVDDHTRNLLRTLVNRVDAISADASFLVERLSTALQDGLEPELVTSVVGALLDQHGPDMANIQTRWAGSAGDITNIVLTLHREEPTRIQALAMFERLIHLKVYRIDDVLRENDRRML
ncbi:MAG: hypothetical protein H7840_16915 [Alphaproteobacteria bacterium]